MARICVFDVNETMLDLKAMAPAFAAVFGDAAVLKEWFGQMLQNALVATITHTYADFGQHGKAALDMVAQRRAFALDPAVRDQLVAGIRTIPAYPDVRPALEQMQAAGLRLAALTNSTHAVAHAQLDNAGLLDLFEAVLSADAVQRLKPAPEPYQMAAQHFGVPISELRLIACHAWDITGVLRAGGAGAFIARPGFVLDPLAPRPDVVGDTMGAIAEQIIASELGG
ncbi:MAG: haloacid dehalogenase type II [Chloroflexaceae bacterium]|nr:haloacid dehalogenase type II [Chloroflexaceae bacterium]